MSKKVEYHSGKLGSFARLVASLVKRDPSLAEDFIRLREHLIKIMPELEDRSKCANCEASMIEHVFSFDHLDAALLISMAFRVREHVRGGFEFTSANQIRSKDLSVSDQVRRRTTKLSKLGYITQLKMGSKKVAGTWVITRRGWQALRGEEVPHKVRVWRGRIEERFEDMTTIPKVLAGKDNLGSAVLYKPSDWQSVQ